MSVLLKWLIPILLALGAIAVGSYPYSNSQVDKLEARITEQHRMFLENNRRMDDKLDKILDRIAGNGRPQQ